MGSSSYALLPSSDRHKYDRHKYDRLTLRFVFLKLLKLNWTIPVLNVRHLIVFTNVYITCSSLQVAVEVRHSNHYFFVESRWQYLHFYQLSFP